MQLAKMEMEIRSASGAQNWYALFTRHQHEKSVALGLSNKCHEVYLPLYRSVRRWQDRAKQLWLPLFPCYVFIREAMDRRLQILTTPGIIHIVGWNGHPAIVPQAQLDTVRQIVESRLTVETHPYLQCGDRVWVKTGPLMGLEGILIRKKGVARVERRIFAPKWILPYFKSELPKCCIHRNPSKCPMCEPPRVPLSVPEDRALWRNRQPIHATLICFVLSP